jgi:plasmid stabilization system protein ParE
MDDLIWTGPALAQLDAIADFIALDKPEAAKAVVRRIFETTDQVPRFKKLGRPVPEFLHPAYRQVWLKPCWVYYRIEGETIFILHVRRAERPFRIEDLFVGDIDPA